MYKYAFIGGGPSTLSAVVNLPLSDRVSSVVIEAGKDYERKICPELRSKSCSSCYGEKCHVLNGLGGSSATFGNKLCRFPASEGIFDGDALARGAGDLEPLIQVPKDRTASKVVPHPNVPNRKVYEAAIATFDDYPNIIASLVDDVRETTEILTETEVQELEERPMGGFRLWLRDGEFIEAEQVVIATGRSGHTAVRRWLSSLNVNFTENSPDVGFRIQLPTQAISEHFFYQNDPKFKFDLGAVGSGRTFCTCRGGAIVPVKFGGGVYADGAFLRKDTGLTNLALMARTEQPIRPNDLEEWCRSENAATSGRLERLRINLTGLSTSQIKDEIIWAMPKGPYANHSEVLQHLVHQLFDEDKIAMLASNFDVPAELVLYGPSIDNFWPRVALSSNFETSNPGLFVIGDSAGYSRGIYQALVAGRAWADAKNVRALSAAAL